MLRGTTSSPQWFTPPANEPTGTVFVDVPILVRAGEGDSPQT